MAERESSAAVPTTTSMSSHAMTLSVDEQLQVGFDALDERGRLRRWSMLGYFVALGIGLSLSAVLGFDTLWISVPLVSLFAAGSIFLRQRAKRELMSVGWSKQEAKEFFRRFDCKEFRMRSADEKRRAMAEFASSLQRNEIRGD